ncbi:MAG TPA: energy-coupling factor transporter ATPase [Halanaerobiales bacterium]|nr:energy-coupling factor transporter ATPase [Halanaerobiales bacterium]
MLIELQDVTHIYDQEQNVKALDDINLEIDEHEFIGIVGHTGSGKTTLVQMFNSLIKPTSGTIYVDGIKTTEKKANLKHVRQTVGLVFQYPEHQLFEETIYDDVAFGPRNLNLGKEEVDKRVKVALDLVGLDFDEFKERSPFNLSGGQQRRVAIAGVLAMRPRVLILDEPSAGLDPQGREKLKALLKRLHQSYNITIILISHRMEEITQLSSRVIVMDHGKIVLNGSPREVFSHKEKLEKLSLELPEITEILFRLRERGCDIRTDIFTVEEAVDEIIKVIGSKENVN